MGRVKIKMIYHVVHSIFLLGVTLSFCTFTGLSSYAFVRSTTSLGIPTSWFTKCIPIWLNNQDSLTISTDAVEADLQRALAEWEGVECAELAFAYQGRTTLNTVGYDSTPDAVNQNVVSFIQAKSDWLTDPLAVALTTVTSCQNETDACAEGATIDADIEVNEAYYVFTASDVAPADRRMDLLSIFTHEIGHLIGLDHPPIPEATMYMSSVEGEIIKRDLAEDDERGVCEIFNPASERGCFLESYDLELGLPTSPPSMEEAVENSNGCKQRSSKGGRLTLELIFWIIILFTGRVSTLGALCLKRAT